MPFIRFAYILKADIGDLTFIYYFVSSPILYAWGRVAIQKTISNRFGACQKILYLKAMLKNFV